MNSSAGPILDFWQFLPIQNDVPVCNCRIGKKGLGLNEYEIGWFFKDQKKSTSKGKPFFESAVNSFSKAIKLAPSIDETNKLLEDYDIDEVNIGEIHHWRAETYSSYLGGAWWKKSCKDWETAKEYGYKDSFKPVRKHCR